MTGISTTFSNQILNNVLGREPFVVPSIYFLALSTTPLANNGVGATEPTFDPMYQRLAISNDKNNFSVSMNRLVSFIRDYTYAPSTTNWPTVTHYLIYDSNVGGNVLLYGELQISRNVEIDTSPFIEANTNQISFDICGGSTPDLAMPTLAANRILDSIFGRTPIFVPPANYFMGVSTTPINSEGIGFTEPTSSDYQRLQIPNDKNSFTFANNKMVTLTNIMKFNVSTVPWGTMTHFFITDTLTGAGNVYWSGRLLHSRNVEIATTLALIPNGFRWILDSCTNTVSPGISPLSQPSLDSIKPYWG